MPGEDGRDGEELLHEVAVADGVDRVAEGTVEPEAGRGHVGVEPERGGGDGARAERRGRGPDGPRLEPLQVPREAPRVGQEVMAEGDGLGGPTMGRAGQDGAGVVAGALDERARQGSHLAAGRPAGREQPQAEVRDDQVVPRPSGVQLGAERAEPVRHGPLDRRMDVLVGILEHEAPSGDLVSYLRKVVFQGPRLRAVEQAGVLQGAYVRDRSLDVLRGQAPVEPERAPQGVRLGCGRRREPSRPELVAASGAHHGPLILAPALAARPRP